MKMSSINLSEVFFVPKIRRCWIVYNKELVTAGNSFIDFPYWVAKFCPGFFPAVPLLSV